MISTVVAVGNKHIEKIVSDIAEVSVLRTIKTRESIYDTVADFNPQCIVLSASLKGKEDWRDIIVRIKNIQPNIKIVFIYGERDIETTSFLNFLIGNNVYDFIVGELSRHELEEAIIENKTFEDVKMYSLEEESKEYTEPQITNKEPEKEIVYQEKIIVKSINNYIQICVAGVKRGIGVSNTVLGMAVELEKRGYRIAVIEYNNYLYRTLKDNVDGYYSYFKMLEEYVTVKQKDILCSYKNIDIYFNNQDLKKNQRKLFEIKSLNYDYIILDAGCYTDEFFDIGEFNRSDAKIVVTGVKPHENNISPIFENEYIDATNEVSFVVNFADVKEYTLFQKAVKNKVYMLDYMPNPFLSPSSIIEPIRSFLKEEIVTNTKKGVFSKWQKNR